MESAKGTPGLSAEVMGLADAFAGDVSLCARNLTTGATCQLRADRTQPCASEAKIYVLLAYAEAVAGGDLDPADRIEFTAEHVVPGTGLMRFAEPGLRPSLSFLGHLMMTVSDNVTTNMLLEAIGGAATVQSCIDRHHIPDTAVDGPLWQSAWISSSATALAQAAEILAAPETTGYPREAADLCKHIMARQLDEGMAGALPWSPLAEDIKATEQFQHLVGSWAGLEYYGKAGALPAYRGDTALFVTKRATYVVGLQCSSMTDIGPLNASSDGSQFSAQIGRVLYDHWA